jgi:hypothetical protein
MAQINPNKPNPPKPVPAKPGVPNQAKAPLQRMQNIAHDVSVHGDAKAHEQTRDLGAKAFAQGQHIKAPGAPNAPIAHEATHTVQQGLPKPGAKPPKS